MKPWKAATIGILLLILSGVLLGMAVNAQDFARGTSQEINSTAVLNIVNAWAGSADITTVGTITTGTWHGTPIAGAYLNLTGFTTTNGRVGTCTLTIASTNVVTTVNNTSVTASSLVYLQPTNLTATVSTLRPYISGVSNGASFAITAVGAGGTETFNYLIIN